MNAIKFTPVHENLAEAAARFFYVVQSTAFVVVENVENVLGTLQTNRTTWFIQIRFFGEDLKNKKKLKAAYSH